MENNNENKTEKVNLGETHEMELPRLDITPYIGKKAKIEKVEEQKGKYGYFIKVSTKVIDTLERNGKEIELRGSRLFNLVENPETHEIGWGKDTKLGLFLKKMKVNHYKDLTGKEVILQTQTNDNGIDFLSF